MRFNLFTLITVIGIISFIFLHGGFWKQEGFAYKENPCKEFTSCNTCADAAGCGWCPDLGQCQPMAQDGFPIHTKDLTTGDPDVSPYLVDGAVPVVSDCPPDCKVTDLGDCSCSKWDYKNSCAPECYAVYGKGCVCPNDDGSGSSVGSSIYQELHISGSYQSNVIKKLATATTNLNKLLKSTRIHICSPHTFVIDRAKC